MIIRRNKEKQASRAGHGFEAGHRHRHGHFKPITELKPRQEGVITFIEGNRRVVQRLTDLGLIPETPVYIMNVAPLDGPVEIVVRGTKLAIGREIAENILVRREGG